MGPIRPRSEVYGKHLISVIASESSIDRRTVLVPSPCAYQEASWLVPAHLHPPKKHRFYVVNVTPTRSANGLLCANGAASDHQTSTSG